ncbi:MAG: hypothetical protein HQ483_09585 [Rhodospirillales bacterium]|nr:hypothetical protein [Rhodospirillales bacterium]
MKLHLGTFKLATCLLAAVWLLPGPAISDTDTVKSRWVSLPAGASARDTARGLISIPENNFGDLPAVLLVGDCQGPKPFQKTWAHRLASQGYVSMLIDPAATADTLQACRSGNTAPALLSAARTYMEKLADFHIDQIAVVSWGYHLPADLGDMGKHISAAVAFYPRCANAHRLRQPFPQLIFKTGQAELNGCITAASMANVFGAEIHVRTYDQARLGFDDPNADFGKAGAPTEAAYNISAHQDAIIRLETFLNSHLRVTLAQAYPSKAFSPLPPKLDDNATPHITTGYGTWTHDPTQPGPNHPPTGRSVFDRVFSKPTAAGFDYDLPDSYEAVIAHLSRFVANDRRGLKPVKQVLIPRGRSLQREAAKPNYYHHPRIVAAIDGEPAPRWHVPPIFLKNRLFLGYQETARVLEVISYNEAASRFEFQVVKNFGPGLKPEILYADRQLCTSCHQNGAPLFPREEWQETNGSTETNNELAKVMSRYHGVMVDRSGEIPAAIDVSTDRANLLPVLQRLWREGCGLENDRAANPCRAAAFTAMLQYRLSNENSFDRDQQAFRSRYTDRLTARWRAFWPNGLYISNSDIPDRDPTEDASIFGLRDPLTPRVPMEIWTGFKRSDLERMIVALAEDLPQADILKLDQWLVDAHRQNPAPQQLVKASCRFTRQLQRGLAFPIAVACQSAELAFTGALTDWAKKPVAGEITSIQVTGFEIRDREKLAEQPSTDPSSKSFQILLNGAHMRLPNGRRLSNLHITLDQARFSETATGNAVLTIDDDFQIVHDALSQLTDSAFTSQPFHAPKLMSKLFENLGIAHTRWCCNADDPAPPVRLDEAISSAETVDSLNAQTPEHIFGRYCARCHRTQNEVPPNFLHGSKSQVTHNIDHCAPRMDYRLSMWDVPVDERTRSPMPPESALPSLGLTKTQWRNSQELATLRKYVKSLMATDRDAQIDYDTLRNCLPDGEQASTAN